MPHPIARLILCAAVFASAQTPNHTSQTFEVASIRPTAPGAQGRGVEYAAGGRFTASGMSLSSLIQEAYGIRGFQISGGPDWVTSGQYSIAAKSESDANKDQIRAMLQRLLADRFQLALRRESKEVNVYTLVVGKGGPKLKDVKLDEANTNRGVRFRGLGRIAGVMASMPQLAVLLSDFRMNGVSILDRPVLDRTGLTGVYDFTLEWSAEEQSSDRTAVNPSASSIFTAVQEQLGLKLEAQKAPVEFFIIDQVAKPTEN
jgi:uncharacterized protein (TIGR03435 family)